MPKKTFYTQLFAEVERIDKAAIAKRHEFLIEGFDASPNPKAMIGGKYYQVFNSNDYLGLRHHRALKMAEHAAGEAYGTGPGAVRFISGSFAIHRELERELALFHGREDAIVFSSAFAANLAVLFSLIKGQSKDSLVSGRVLVVSDELNHRSIIDGIRLANLSGEDKTIFAHMNVESLVEVLERGVGKYDRVLVVTDGVFSMLGEYQDLKKIQEVCNQYDDKYPAGVMVVVDDCHGVAAFGSGGRGTEEVSGGRADVLVGTLGKGFGADGGYVVADSIVIDYLRESAATYIYSNSISPGTAAAALTAVKLVNSGEGAELLNRVSANAQLFARLVNEAGLEMAASSHHPIQPLLIGDPEKTKSLKLALFGKGYLITSINYPVVSKGRDEIRIQLSSLHTNEEIQEFVRDLKKSLDLI